MLPLLWLVTPMDVVFITLQRTCFPPFCGGWRRWQYLGLFGPNLWFLFAGRSSHHKARDFNTNTAIFESIQLHATNPNSVFQTGVLSPSWKLQKQFRLSVNGKDGGKFINWTCKQQNQNRKLSYSPKFPLKHFKFCKTQSMNSLARIVMWYTVIKITRSKQTLFGKHNKLVMSCSSPGWHINSRLSL